MFILTLRRVPGVEIDELPYVAKAIEIADKTGAFIEFDLDGVTVLACPGDSPRWLLDSWLKAKERGVTFVSSQIIPAGTRGPRPSGPTDGADAPASR